MPAAASPLALTIGMATFDDYAGLYMTVQALRLYHGEAIRSVPCELIVIDNHPDGPHGADTAKLVRNWIRGDFGSARYVPFAGVVGTSAPRDQIFRESQADAVLVLDSHVMLAPETIARLLDYYRQHPDSMDLLHGPMIYDDLKNQSTHFDDQWRAEMWGTWGTDPRGDDADAEPFEIPGCGLGLFTCRKAAWPGFPAGLEGFGAEEMSLHALFRQLGRKTLCLPFLRWLHRFGRPGGVPYSLTRRNKVRNYLIWHRALGLPPDRVRHHFVDEVGMTVQEFEAIYSEVKHVSQEAPPQSSAPAAEQKPGCNSCAEKARQRQAQLAAAPAGNPLWQVGPEATLDDLFRRASTEPSSLFMHLAKLKELAGQSELVVELAMQEGVGTIGLLAGQPAQLVSVGTPGSPMAKALEARKGATDFAVVPPGAELPDCELLVIDGAHHADDLWAALTTHAPHVLHWIAIHDTASYPEVGEGGRRPGLLPALRYWLRRNQDWSVLSHNQANNGLTVLTSEAAEKKALPGNWKMLGNLMKAVGQHLASGLEAVDEELLDARLDVCATCDQRTDNRCAVCGCFVEVKASWLSQDCPLAKWPAAAKHWGWEPSTPPDPLPEWPEVVVICPSYRRPKLLANTIAQFLAQDYPAEHRRLIVLEDSGQLDSQTGDGWEIVSVPDRYESITAKYQRLLELAEGADVVVLMDDDDLYAPWHVSAHVAAMRDRQWSKPSKILSLYNTQTPYEENSAGRFHGSIAARRSFLMNLGGWGDYKVAAFDQHLLGKLQWKAEPGDPCLVNPKPSYVFRWQSTGVHHSQGYMKSMTDETWWEEYAKAMTARGENPPRTTSPAFDEETERLYRDFFASSPALTQA